MQPYSATKPPKRRVGRLIVLILLRVFTVLCLLPAGGYGAYYLSLDDGPYSGMPSPCATLTGAEARAITGGSAGENRATTAHGHPIERCYWSDRVTPSKTALTLAATLHARTPVAGSLDEARSGYRYALMPLQRVPSTGTVLGRPVDGVGQQGWCAGESRDRSRTRWECVLRAGNVVVDLTIEPPYRPTEPAVDQAALDRFVTDVATPILRDYVEDLKA